MNFKREPKKVWSVVISLSLGGIILLAVSSALLLQSPERLAQYYLVMSIIKLYIDSDKEHTKLLYSGNPLNENLKQEISKISGVRNIQTLRNRQLLLSNIKTKTEEACVICLQRKIKRKLRNR